MIVESLEQDQGIPRPEHAPSRRSKLGKAPLAPAPAPAHTARAQTESCVRTIVLTTIAMVAFAANSVLARLAFATGGA